MAESCDTSVWLKFPNPGAAKGSSSIQPGRVFRVLCCDLSLRTLAANWVGLQGFAMCRVVSLVGLVGLVMWGVSDPKYICGLWVASMWPTFLGMVIPTNYRFGKLAAESTDQEQPRAGVAATALVLFGLAYFAMQPAHPMWTCTEVWLRIHQGLLWSDGS